MNCGGKWLLGFIVGFIFILVALSFGKVYTRVKIEAPFHVCIDDGDCMSKGDGYVCFQYICYPWADDTAIPKKDRYSKSGQNDLINSNLLSHCKHSICQFISCSPGKRLASQTTIARTI